MNEMRMVFAIFMLFLSSLQVASAYETIEVKNGGTIKGVVEFSGAQAPRDPMLTVTSDTEKCGDSVPAKKYLIRDGKIENVVVSLRGIQAGKALPQEVVRITSKNCAFVPRIAVGFKGNEIIITNDDPMLHTFDVHLSHNGKELFHSALHEQGASVTKKIRTTGQLALSCYVHPWQSATVLVFDHPYATITDEGGQFLIKDIPPGTYTIEAWHEALGTRVMEGIKVESGKTSTVHVKYAP